MADEKKETAKKGSTGYVTLTPVHHNGKHYARGAKITLTEAEAQQLLKLEAILAEQEN